MKNTMNEMKNIMERSKIRLHQAEERTCEFKGKQFEITQ